MGCYHYRQQLNRLCHNAGHCTHFLMYSNICHALNWYANVLEET